MCDVLRGWGCLPSYPGFGIEFCGLFSELEVERAVSAAVVCDGAEYVTGTYFLSFLYDGAGEVAIDGDVAAVTNKYVACAGELEDTGDDAVEDGTGTGSRAADVVCSFIVELDILHARHVVDAETVAQHILSGDGDWQKAFVLFEGAVELSVCSRKP